MVLCQVRTVVQNGVVIHDLTSMLQGRAAGPTCVGMCLDPVTNELEAHALSTLLALCRNDYEDFLPTMSTSMILGVNSLKPTALNMGRSESSKQAGWLVDQLIHKLIQLCLQAFSKAKATVRGTRCTNYLRLPSSGPHIRTGKQA